MSKFVFNQKNFLRGLSKSPTVGKGFPRMDGVDLYRDLGYMSAGYGLEEIDSSDITKEPHQLVLDNSDASGEGNAKLWAIANGTIYNVDLDVNPPALSFSSSISTQYTNGAEAFRNNIYIASGSNIARGSLAATNSSTLSLSETWQTGLNDSNAQHPMKEMGGKLYVLDGRYVDTITDSATFTSQDLDLEEGWVGISADAYGEFLAIGAIKNPDTSSGYGNDALFGGSRSRLYFWDRTSKSWDKDRSTEIDGKLIWVKNNKGRLYTLIEHRSSLWDLGYFDGNTIKTLKKIDMRDYGTLANAGHEPAKAIVRDSLLFGTKYRIFRYGAFDSEMPSIVSVPYYDTSITQPQCMCWAEGTRNQLFLGLYGGDALHALRDSFGSGTPASYIIETPEVSHPDGIKQKLRSIKIVTQPLASGDRLDISRKIDNGTWDGSRWKTFTYDNDGAETDLLIDEGFEFSTLQLRLETADGDDTQIKSIIIETENAEPK